MLKNSNKKLIVPRIRFIVHILMMKKLKVNCKTDWFFDKNRNLKCINKDSINLSVNLDKTVKH